MRHQLQSFQGTFNATMGGVLEGLLKLLIDPVDLSVEFGASNVRVSKKT